MDKQTDHKSKKVPVSGLKKEDKHESGVFFSKLMGLSKSQLGSGTIMLNKLFTIEGSPDERLTAAVFMVFGYNIKNVQPLFSNGTKVMMLADPRIDDYEELRLNENTEKNLKILWVKKDSQIKNSAFHPKLYLLKFDKVLRVVIGSANLFIEDWTKWSNVCWVKDFPFKTDGMTSKHSNFRRDLETFVKASLGDRINELKTFSGIDLKDYDFTKAGVELVYSLPLRRGLSEGDKCGFEMVSQIMTNNPPTRPYDFKDTKIYYSCSCIGAINFGIVYQFVTSVIPNLKVPQICDYASQTKYFNMLKLIYPTQSYINGLTPKNSDTACLFFNKKIYHKVSFNTDILAQFENNEDVYGDENIVSHSKIFVVVRDSKIDDDTVIYIGSHNFTKAAWGKISRQKYEISNYELGVMYPPQHNSAELKRSIISRLSFKVPAWNYDDDDIPFFTVDK